VNGAGGEGVWHTLAGAARVLGSRVDRAVIYFAESIHSGYVRISGTTSPTWGCGGAPWQARRRPSAVQSSLDRIPEFLGEIERLQAALCGGGSGQGALEAPGTV